MSSNHLKILDTFHNLSHPKLPHVGQPSMFVVLNLGFLGWCSMVGCLA